jgi:hypothetical protein
MAGVAAWIDPGGCPPLGLWTFASLWLVHYLSHVAEVPRRDFTQARWRYPTPSVVP